LSDDLFIETKAFPDTEFPDPFRTTPNQKDPDIPYFRLVFLLKV